MSSLNPNSLNRLQVTHTSGVICHVKAMAQGSWLVTLNPFSNTSVPFTAQVKTVKIYHCINAPLTHMPFSICGSTVAEVNTVYCWEDGYVITTLFKHKLLHSQNDLYAAHISSIQDGNFVWILNVLMTGRDAVSWCCCFDIFLRTRVMLLESRQLMQLPFCCLRKPVPFEAHRTSEHTGYLLYTDLRCFRWTMLNENTTQKGLCCIPAFCGQPWNWNV